MRLLLTVLFVAAGWSLGGCLEDAKGRTIYAADIIGYVTAEQVAAAREAGLLVGALKADQRRKLPKTSDDTRLQLFEKGEGRYGIALIAPPASEEFGTPPGS
uniref:Uncharacterized protein n=1 Tax=uncultured Armatimonadetes bacterium TaxID=157466 RepID=A0A6J4K0J8_9BACT|nr:hypothetical protein AVDCRST_MAG63-4438 [uncultured Armatimonadetes bacterium]